MKVTLRISDQQRQEVIEFFESWTEDSMIWAQKIESRDLLSLDSRDKFMIENIRKIYPDIFKKTQNLGAESLQVKEKIYYLNNSGDNTWILKGDEISFIGRRHGLVMAPTMEIFDDLHNCEVVRYESFRKDQPWFVAGLDHPTINKIYKKYDLVGLDRPDLQFFHGAIKEYSPETGEYEKKFTPPAIFYRRCGAMGL